MKRQPLRRIGLGAVALGLLAATLAAVFAAYLNPHTVMELATRAWSCF